MSDQLLTATAAEVRRYYERLYPNRTSFYLAYCYAVGRHPSDGKPVAAGVETPAEWIAAKTGRAIVELDLVWGEEHDTAESEAVIARLWEYACQPTRLQLA